MTGLEPGVRVTENYRRFAQHEAAGKSALYEELAYAVAADPVVLSFLQGLPEQKRQPNLLFAAARFLLGAPADPHTLRALVQDRRSDLAHVMRTRRTQTNEAGRCAVLLPALSQIPGPLAVIEVGAAAGLTLLHDFYSYDYDGRRVVGLDPDGPLLRCHAVGPVPVPDAVPEIVWRSGLDLNPLDISDAEDLQWLQCLVWPGDEVRAERLVSAACVARRYRPLVHRGDLLEDLPRVATAAPADATLVIFHTAVLAYVNSEKREAFAALVAELGAVWLSNEGEGVLPAVREQANGKFLLVRDGTELLARADPHGAWIEWVG
jgi:hypothetical protein